MAASWDMTKFLVVILMGAFIIHEVTAHAHSHIDNVYVQEGLSMADKEIKRKLTELLLANEPVTRILTFGLDANRVAFLRAISGATMLGTGPILDRINLTDSNTGQPMTGDNNNMAYRPNYGGSSSPIGTIFINMRGVFPCLGDGQYFPSCKVFSHEEDRLPRNQLVEAGDSGNNFRIFSSLIKTDIPTFGFGFEGCPELTSTCLPTFFANTIICYLPRNSCGYISESYSNFEHSS